MPPAPCKDPAPARIRTTHRILRRMAWSMACLALTSIAQGPDPVPSRPVPPPTDIRQQFHHRAWDATRGLPDNRVQALAQTSDGYLWIGTRYGLVRFDGTTFTTYTRANTPILPHNDVHRLVVGEQGDLWMPVERLFHRTPGTPWAGLQAIQHPSPKVLGVIRSPDGGVLAQRAQDGTWHHYRSPEQVTPLPANLTEASLLFCSKDGALYGVSNGHLEIRSSVNTPPRTFPLPPSPKPYAVRSDFVEDPTGNLWLRHDVDVNGRTHLYLITADGPRIAHPQLPSNAAREGFLTASRDGALWMPSEKVGLVCWLNGQLAHYALPWGRDSDFALCMLEDAEGNLWVGAEESGLHCLRPHHVQTLPPSSGLPAPNVRAVLAAHGQLWIATDGGLAIAELPDPATGRKAHSAPRLIPRTDPRLTPLHGQSIRALAPAPDRSVWVGTDRGLWRVEKDRTHAIPLPLQTNPFDTDGVAARKIRALASDRAGRLWIATASDLLRLEPATDPEHQPLITRVAKDLKPLALLVDREGLLWVATDGFGVVRFNPLASAGSTPWITPTQLKEPDPTALPQPFLHLNPTNGLSSLHAWDLHQDRRGDIWIATETGLNRILPNHPELGRPKPNPAVAPTPDARSSGNLPPPQSTPLPPIVHYTTAHGLPDNQINGILDDALGHLWCSTDRGVFHVPMADLDAVAAAQAEAVRARLYLEVDGLPALETNGRLSHPAVTQTEDGSLFFPTVNGLASLNPRALHEDLPEPLALVEEVRIDGRLARTCQPGAIPDPAFRPGVRASTSIASTASIASASDSVPSSDEDVIVVPPGQGRVLEFRFTAAAFTTPELLRFRYRLDGYDAPNTWHETTDLRRAFYTNLDPGTYAFHVMARGVNGDWGSPGKGSTVQRLPLLRETTAFKIGAGVGTASLLVLAAGLRLRRVRRLAAMAAELALFQERAAIARDVHDRLGPRITQLGLLTEPLDATSAFAGVPPARDALQAIAKLAKEILALLDQALWSIDPTEDHLASLVAYLRETSDEICSASGLTPIWEVPTPVPRLPLNAHIRRQILLFTNEALNNALRHAKASTLRISLELRPNPVVLKLSVQDDGLGIPRAILADPANPSWPNPLVHGLNHLHDRSISLGGTLEIVTGRGLGTTLTLTIPLQHRPYLASKAAS